MGVNTGRRHIRPRHRLHTWIIIVCLFCCYYLSNELIATPKALPSPGIPNKIWQVFFNYAPYARLGEFVQSWNLVNQDCSYTLMSNQGANEFVRKHYFDRPHILQTFLDLQYPIFRADLLRYMLLEAEGGVYSDIDTAAIKPIRDWVPQHLQPYTRAIVGIEYDQLDGPPGFGFKERLSFVQWTLASVKGHSMMKSVVETVVSSIHETARRKNVTVAALQVTDDEVGCVTGPGVFTNAVLQSLSEITGTTVTYRNVTGMREPRLFGDVLIMPVAAFGTGQPHSGSPDDIGEDTLVRHAWKMSWRTETSN